MTELESLKKECLACRMCAIGGCDINGCNSNVFSTMNPVPVMVVGQNPGAEEVRLGIPFVGISGKTFDAALEKIVGLKRADVYVTNVVKCYTHNNRKPTDGEVTACRAFLDREVELVKPKVIVALGSYALKALTGMSGVSKHCGELVYSPRYKVHVLALLHPSPLNTNVPEKREQFHMGLAKLAEFLRQLNG